MDWGLGNPNTTAALIATLMIAVWVLAFIRGWGFWIALGLFTILGGCLIHTFSRGGLVAAFVGLLPLIAVAPRPWPMRKIIAIGVAVWAMIGFALYLNAHERYSQGVVKQDRSITNRLHVWKHAPLMVVDAPKGWGFKNGAKAYMRWYQPLEDTESYRTFVNSHLEWLIEFGWPMRFIYVLAWCGVFLLCVPSRSRRWFAVPLGVWAAFAIASTFSSVAESPWVWIVPGISLLAVIMYRIFKRDWPQSSMWRIPTGFAALSCLVLLVAGGKGTKVQGSRKQVVIGHGKVGLWLVADERVLGGDRFAKSLRRYLDEHPADRTVGIVWSVAELPNDLSQTTVVVAGLPDGLAQGTMQRVAASAAKLIFLSPGCYPQEAGMDTDRKPPVETLFGEFSQSVVLSAWEDTGKVRRIEGAGDFLPAWPQIIFEGIHP